VIAVALAPLSAILTVHTNRIEPTTMSITAGNK